MIRIWVDNIGSYALPVYDVNEPVFYYDAEYVVNMTRVKRVWVPLFEVYSESIEYVRMQVLKLICDICKSTGVYDGTVLLPIRHDLKINELYDMNLGIMLMAGDAPFESQNPSWVPESFELESFSRDVENMTSVMDVMSC